MEFNKPGLNTLKLKGADPPLPLILTFPPLVGAIVVEPPSKKIPLAFCTLNRI